MTLDVECSECGATLDDYPAGTPRGRVYIAVKPCQNCLDGARQAGRDEAEAEQ